MPAFDPDDDETFEDFLRRTDYGLSHWLSRHSEWGSIPWQDPEETANDLRWVLYEAYLNYKPGKGSFQRYWQVLWARFRAKAIRNMLRQKRSVLIIVISTAEQDVPETVEMETFIPLPIRGFDPLEEVVWTAIQHGYTPLDIIESLPISRRRYYSLIKHWKEHINL